MDTHAQVNVVNIIITLHDKIDVFWVRKKFVNHKANVIAMNSHKIDKIYRGS